MDEIEITLLSDYVAWPLWGPSGPMAEDELALPDPLKERIRAWFNASLEPNMRRDDWPTWTAPALRKRQAPKGGWFHAEADAICEELQIALGPRYHVSYQR